VRAVPWRERPDAQAVRAAAGQAIARAAGMVAWAMTAGDMQSPWANDTPGRKDAGTCEDGSALPGWVAR
jgi:hypothetical protein